MGFLIILAVAYAVAFLPLIFLSCAHAGKILIWSLALLSCAWLVGVGFFYYRIFGAGEGNPSLSWIFSAIAGVPCLAWAAILSGSEPSK